MKYTHTKTQRNIIYICVCVYFVYTHMHIHTKHFERNMILKQCYFYAVIFSTMLSPPEELRSNLQIFLHCFMCQGSLLGMRSRYTAQ